MDTLKAPRSMRLAESSLLYCLPADDRQVFRQLVTRLNTLSPWAESEGIGKLQDRRLSLRVVSQTVCVRHTCESTANPRFVLMLRSTNLVAVSKNNQCRRPPGLVDTEGLTQFASHFLTWIVKAGWP